MLVLGGRSLFPVPVIYDSMSVKHRSGRLEPAQPQRKGARRQPCIHEHDHVLQPQHRQQPGRRHRDVLAETELPPTVSTVQHDLHRVHLSDRRGHLPLQPRDQEGAFLRLTREHSVGRHYDGGRCIIQSILFISGERIIPDNEGRLRKRYTHLRPEEIVCSISQRYDHFAVDMLTIHK